MLRGVTSDSFRSTTKKFWESHFARYKAYAPYAGFLLYAFAGALLLHCVELYVPVAHDSRTEQTNNCFRSYGYFAAMFYVISVCSTIGFGNVMPCTWATKVLSLLYSFVGVPLVLYILTDLGNRMSKLAAKGYFALYQAYRKRFPMKRKRSKTVGALLSTRRPFSPGKSSIQFADFAEMTFRLHSRSSTVAEPDLETDSIVESPRVDAGDQEEFVEDIVDVPVWIGVTLFLTCLSLCTLFYNVTDGSNFWEALYFAFLTFVSGDFSTRYFRWSIPMYLLIFMGFSTLMMTVDIVRQNVENMMKRVKRDVQLEMMRQMELTGGTASADDILNARLKAEGMSWMISSEEATNLETFAVETAQKRNAETQTYSALKPVRVSKAVSARYSAGNPEASVQAGCDSNEASTGVPLVSCSHALQQTVDDAQDRATCCSEDDIVCDIDAHAQAVPESRDVMTSYSVETTDEASDVMVRDVVFTIQAPGPPTRDVATDVYDLAGRYAATWSLHPATVSTPAEL